MTLGATEERQIRTVRCLLDCGPDDRRWLEGEALAWLDPDEPARVHVTVHAQVEDWDVRVYSSGDAEVVWKSEKECPGLAEWMAIPDDQRLAMFQLEPYTPSERPMLVTLEMTEMGPQWEVCLAPLGLGHLHLPYVPTPALESL